MVTPFESDVLVAVNEVDTCVVVEVMCSLRNCVPVLKFGFCRAGLCAVLGSTVYVTCSYRLKVMCRLW